MSAEPNNNFVSVSMKDKDHVYNFALECINGSADGDFVKAMLYNVKSESMWPVLLGGGGKSKFLPRDVLLELSDIPNERSSYILLGVMSDPEGDSKGVDEDGDEYYEFYPIVIFKNPSTDRADEYWLEAFVDESDDEVKGFVTNLTRDDIERLWQINSKLLLSRGASREEA